MTPVTQIKTKEAFDLLKSDKNSILIDVRTPEEFNFVGTVNPTEFNNRMILLPWQTLPSMQQNPDFANQLEESVQKLLGAIHDPKLIFLCRVGGRSNQAAQHSINLGYKHCYNVVSGFEGDLNQQSQRGKINGWKFDLLPWRQS